MHWILSLILGIAFISCSSQELSTDEKQVISKHKQDNIEAPSTNAQSALSVASTNIELVKPPQNIESFPKDKVFGEVQSRVQSYIADGLEGSTQEASKSPVVRAKVLRLWQAFVSEFDEPIGEVTNVENETKYLPEEIAEAKRSNKPFLDDLVAGEVSFLDDQNELYQASGIYLTGLYAATFAVDDIALLLSDRAAKLPQTKADVVIFHALDNSIREIGSGASQARPKIENLIPYTEATNPIYRLLALKATAAALPNDIESMAAADSSVRRKIENDRIKVYQTYIKENDPVIIAELIHILATNSSKEASSLLKKIREQQQQQGDQNLVTQTDYALRQVERNVQSANTSN